MKGLSWVSLAVTSFLAGGAQKILAVEQVCLKRSGVTQCREGVIPHLHASGIINIEKTQIKGLCSIKGQFIINNAHLQTLQAYGQGEILKTTITGKSKIYGKTIMVDSTLDAGCEVWSSHLSLHNSQVGSIKMHGGSLKEGLIIIGPGSTVVGDIVFAEKAGVVEVGEGAHIGGQVKNGKVIASQKGGE